MLTTFTLTLCANLLLPLAETKEIVDQTPAMRQMLVEKSVAALQTPAKPVETKKTDDELLEIEANVVSYTNMERARYGLPALQVDKQLMQTAREHCSWMTRSRIFQHTRRPVAENIAMGQPSSQDVVRSWMNSSGHRANILNPNHRHIGVSAYRTEGGTIYWVQQFTR
jgi:uncharacterized protein YkwD